jgi:hemophore-related protein
MVKLSSTGLVVAVGGLSLTAAISLGISLAISTGVASADPDLGPLLNTTCTYPQAVAALNAESPTAAQQFDAAPVAKTWLRTFLAAPLDQRQRMIQQVQSLPDAQQYEGLVLQVASVCNNY